jgi:hypothetical protein
MEITKAAPPSPPFSVAVPIGEGQEVDPGDELTVTVSLTAHTALPLHDMYSITAAGTGGARHLAVQANTSRPQGTITSAFGCMHRFKNIEHVGAPVVSHQCIVTGPGRTAERFSKGANHSLRLGPETSLWCVAAAARRAEPGTPLEVGTCTGSDKQRWRWDTADRIVHMTSGLCIAVQHGNPASNTPLVLATCTGKRNQVWDESALHERRGEVSAGVGARGQLCMADPTAPSRPGAPITLAGCDLSAGQVFTYSSQTLRIARGCVTAAGNASGAPLRWMPCSGGSAQTWTWRTDHSLYNPARRLCLDDPHSTTTPGRHLQVWTCNGTAAQHWLVPAPG